MCYLNKYVFRNNVAKIIRRERPQHKFAVSECGGVEKAFAEGIPADLVCDDILEDRLAGRTGSAPLRISELGRRRIGITVEIDVPVDFRNGRQVLL